MELDAARWSRLEVLYEQAVARPEDDRRAFLESSCADDPALCAEILAMLADTERPLHIERLVVDDEERPEPPDALLGAQLGPWRLAKVLGRGGSGTVYLVERADGHYEQRAALKLIAPRLLARESIERFRIERRILARLVHPNIARLIDGGFTPEGTPYLVMEFVDGMSLTAYCDEHRLTIDERLRLFRVVCGAVQHAHRALVVHRDLKPSNIYVSSAGEVKLLDFGIAKLLEPDALGVHAAVTRTEHRVLTPAYAAPEQIRGEAVTTATDVYGLGVVLFEILTAARPFDVEALSASEAERVVAEREPPPLTAMVRSAPPFVSALRSTTPSRLMKRLRGDLGRICLMALRKEPERRYVSVEQLADDVDRFLRGHPVLAQHDTFGYRARRFVARNRVAVGVAAAFAVLLSTFVGVSTLQARAVAVERDRASDERDKAQEIVRVLVDLFQSANPDVVPNGDKQPIGAFLERAEGRVLRELDPRPDVKATMKHVLGQMHRARSDFPKGRTLLEEALTESRGLHGADALETLRIQIDLSGLLVDVGEKERARELLEHAVARCSATVGERHPLTAQALHILADTYEENTREFETLHKRGLEIRRTVLGPDDLDLARSLNSVAIVEMNHERYPESRARFEEGLRIAERSHGGRNMVAHALLNDYAALLGRAGEFAEAEELQRRALALATEIVGPESTHVATDYNNLAAVHANQGRLESATELFRQAYDRYLRLVGPDHGLVANVARNLGVVLNLQDRPAEGRPWLERAVASSEKAEGANARAPIYIRTQLAGLLVALGERAEAVRILEAAIPVLEKLAPPEGHYTAADAHLSLGHALLMSGRAAEAEPHVRTALSFRERIQPEGHPQRAAAECDLARVLAARHRNEDAALLLERCVPRLRAYGLVQRSVLADVERLHQALK